MIFEILTVFLTAAFYVLQLVAGAILIAYLVVFVALLVPIVRYFYPRRK